MNDLSNEALENVHCCKPIPTLAFYSLVALFVTGFSVSLLILIVVHNALFFVSLLLLSALVLAFIRWNNHNWRRKGAAFYYLRSFPDTDLRFASEGQLVKVTGLVSCGSVSLESSYEKAPRCIYASTLLYEYNEIGVTQQNGNKSCLRWSLVFSERFSTDFYITDQKSGTRAIVKAGPGSKVIPLITESTLVSISRKCRILSPSLRNWLKDRNLSAEARLLRLEEGYVKEGGSATVMGMLQRNNGVAMIVQPSELMSTGCLWEKLLLPVDIDGLILGVPDSGNWLTCSVSQPAR